MPAACRREFHVGSLRTAACLVDLATQLKTGRIVTLGSDFRVYRWGRNRPFDLLLDS